jgi:hypothetical protein
MLITIQGTPITINIPNETPENFWRCYDIGKTTLELARAKKDYQFSQTKIGKYINEKL